MHGGLAGAHTRTATTIVINQLLWRRRSQISQSENSLRTLFVSTFLYDGSIRILYWRYKQTGEQRIIASSAFSSNGHGRAVLDCSTSVGVSEFASLMSIAGETLPMHLPVSHSIGEAKKRKGNVRAGIPCTHDGTSVDSAMMELNQIVLRTTMQFNYQDDARERAL